MQYIGVSILIDGFADEKNLKSHGTARYRPNIVLIQTGDATIVVDPGTVERQQDIVDALTAKDVALSDVTHVIHTHHHLDHNRNSGLFANVPVIDAWAMWRGTDYDTNPPVLPAGIRIEKTPGHTYDSLTVFVDTEEGVVAVCGDVLWWDNDTQSDVYAENAEELATSRKLVLSGADFVIPGHGPKFPTKR